MSTVGRPLKRTTRQLANRVILESSPLPKTKGRHWTAYQDGKIVGEFKTWQKGYYAKGAEVLGTQVEISKNKSYMIKQSWIITDENTSDLHPDRYFKGPGGWKEAIEALPNSLVKRL
jgi:hypothetical protein